MRKYSIAEGTESRICTACGISFEKKRPSDPRKFCSTACYHKPRPAEHKSNEERFWSKVNKSDSCWLWTSGQNGSGYGQFNVKDAITGKRSPRLAHRFSYLLHHGSIPCGLCVLHNCPDGDNPRCVNPAHLYLGTRRDNNQDAVRKGQRAIGNRFPQSKLTVRTVQEIRQRAATGESDKALAVAFGVNVAQINRVRHRKAWTHVP
jgi:hypothetical protein